MKKIFIDTDIGSDIDDAFALIYLLKCKDIKIEGITTVYRNSKARAKLAKTLLKSYEICDIPVYFGVDDAIVQNAESVVPAWAEQIYDENGKYVPDQCIPEYMNTEVDGADGVIKMLEALKKDKDIEVLAIGPATNVALAIRLSPETFIGRKITVMGGCYNKLVLSEGGKPQSIKEANVLSDPEAMRIVFSSFADVTMIGLDVCLPCQMDIDTYNQVFNGKEPEILVKLLQIWKKSFKTDNLPILYDPVAAISITHPEFFQFIKENINISLMARNRAVVVKDKSNKKINIATNIDVSKVLSEFSNIVANK